MRDMIPRGNVQCTLWRRVMWAAVRWTMNIWVMYLPLVRTSSGAGRKIRNALDKNRRLFNVFVQIRFRTWTNLGHHWLRSRNDCIVLPIEECDEALKCTIGFVPVFGRDPQLAGDLVAVAPQQSSFVRCYTIGDNLSINLPGYTDMVRVETTGHTNQGLLSLIVHRLSTLIFWWSENRHIWLLDAMLWWRQRHKTIQLKMNV